MYIFFQSTKFNSVNLVHYEEKGISLELHETAESVIWMEGLDPKCQSSLCFHGCRVTL